MQELITRAVVFSSLVSELWFTNHSQGQLGGLETLAYCLLPRGPTWSPPVLWTHGQCINQCADHAMCMRFPQGWLRHVVRENLLPDVLSQARTVSRRGYWRRPFLSWTIMAYDNNAFHERTAASRYIMCNGCEPPRLHNSSLFEIIRENNWSRIIG